MSGSLGGRRDWCDHAMEEMKLVARQLCGVCTGS